MALCSRQCVVPATIKCENVFCKHLWKTSKQAQPQNCISISSWDGLHRKYCGYFRIFTMNYFIARKEYAALCWRGTMEGFAFMIWWLIFTEWIFALGKLWSHNMEAVWRGTATPPSSYMQLGLLICTSLLGATKQPVEVQQLFMSFPEQMNEKGWWVSFHQST